MIFPVLIEILPTCYYGQMFNIICHTVSFGETLMPIIETDNLINKWM